MDPRLLSGMKAERHRLLGDARRLAIVEALEVGPCQVAELARILGLHPTTVRAHLGRLLEAGVLEEEPGTPTGRGRPSKRYRLRQPLLADDPEVRLFVGSLVSLVHDAYGDRAVISAETEGARRGRQLAPSFRHPSVEQAVREVVKTLNRLSFDPAAPTRRDDTVRVDIHHCPFDVDPHDPRGAIVCAFHEGLVRGLAEGTSGQDVEVQLVPFVAPGVCRVELSFTKAPTSRAKSNPASGKGGHNRSSSSASALAVATMSPSSASSIAFA